MQHVQDLSSLNLDGCGLTIGSFDGVHLGHQALIKALVADAHQAGLPAVVLTFYPHPATVLRDRLQAFYLTLPHEKEALMAALGVDYVVTQRFDVAFSRMPAGTFLDTLERHLTFKRLWIGEDFAFGHQREGDRALLDQASKARGFSLYVLPRVVTSDGVVRSSRIRQALREGDVSLAARLLGRPFNVPGVVVQGAGRGKQLGVPTANLSVDELRAYPGPGVYACHARVAGECWKAVTNIGVRPTFENGQVEPTIEAHLLDCSADLYGKPMELYFLTRLREERRFADPDALMAQIHQDVHAARTYLNREVESRND